MASRHMGHLYGWANVGQNVELPYITRVPNLKFIPVKLIDRLILRHYPSTYPSQLADKPPLICQFLNSVEANLLSILCMQKYQTSNLICAMDPIVNLAEFQAFFHIVQQTYPDVRIPEHGIGNGEPGEAVASPEQSKVINKAAVVDEHQNHGRLPIQQNNTTNEPVTISHMPISKNYSTKEPVPHGWLLIKDAMIPYVERSDQLLLPLNVLQGAAKLLLGIHVETVPSRSIEVDCLNYMCKLAMMTFEFEKGTSLVDLTTLIMIHPNSPMRKLPTDNPLAALASVSGSPQATPTSANPVIPLPRPPVRYSLPPPPPLLPLDKLVPQPCIGVSPPDRNGPPQTETKHLGVNFNAMMKPGKVTKRGRKRNALDNAVMSNAEQIHQSIEISDDEVQPVFITPVEIFGKTISCITRGRLKPKYGLVESVCRVFFPEADLIEFVHYLENDLSVKLYSLKQKEEAAFIEFFGIPTDQLCCNLLIKVKHFVERMSWLNDKFGGIEGTFPAQEADTTQQHEPTQVIPVNGLEHQLVSQAMIKNNYQHMSEIDQKHLKQAIERLKQDQPHTILQTPE